MGGKVDVKECCVRCGAETEYLISTPIDLRRWYVEGSGQLCEECWLKLWPIHKEENGKTEQEDNEGS